MGVWELSPDKFSIGVCVQIRFTPPTPTRLNSTVASRRRRHSAVCIGHNAQKEAGKATIRQMKLLYEENLDMMMTGVQHLDGDQTSAV